MERRHDSAARLSRSSTAISESLGIQICLDMEFDSGMARLGA